MVANYYGGWSHDDDVALVEAVLRNVRNGKSVIDGCKEYEEMTNGKRSASASKYRFHTQLKEKYVKAYELARMEGKKVKAEKSKRITKKDRLEKTVNILEGDATKEVTIDDVLVIVNHFKKQEEAKNGDGADRLENEELRKENARLQGELKEMEITLKQNIEQQAQILDALKVLESAGINLNIPKHAPKYAINKDGTIDKL